MAPRRLAPRALRGSVRDRELHPARPTARRPRLARVALVLYAAIASAACAAPAPLMLGGRTTPSDRVDLGLGGAARIPLGDLAPPEMPRDAEALLHFAEPGGVVPVAWSRWAIGGDWNAGVLVAGTSLRVELLGETLLTTSTIRVIYGVLPYGGYARADTPNEPTMGPSEPAEGWRVGALAPIALAAEMGGVFEGWFGARIGFEHVEGTLGASDARRSGALSAFRGGLVLGLAAGLRRVHVIVELSADYEYWAGELAGVAIERQGFVLTPGFAIRFRF